MEWTCSVVRLMLASAHLSLYGHFDSEGNKVSKELFQPVWSGQRQKNTDVTHFYQITYIILREGSRQAMPPVLYAALLVAGHRHLLFIPLQMQNELVKIQITVRRVGRNLSLTAV